MLIVCPSCATSYLIDQAAIGPAGRVVRCTRCKATWFAVGANSASGVAAVDDKTVAQAETQAQAPESAEAAPAADSAASQPEPAQAGADDFSVEVAESVSTTETAAPPSEPRPPESTPAEKDAPEPAMIADAPSLVPPMEIDPLPEAAQSDPEHAVTEHVEPEPAEPESDEDEYFVAPRQRPRVRHQPSRRSSRWTAVILVLVAFNVALIGARNDVVRYLPQTASLFAAVGLPVNVRQLSFENVKISKETQDGASVLIVEGTIVSNASGPVEVPRLRFAVRNATGQEVYTWNAPPTRNILGPGERLAFRSQIPTPPTDASDVMVRFLTAQDAVAR
jgi:predicted Zn finger-like uncharacterized protein